MIILGAGLVGIELGLHLIRYGKDVTILEMTDHMSDGGNFLHMLGLHAEIRKRGLKILFNTQAVRITDTGVACHTPQGDRFYEADQVVYAAGQKPLREETTALAYCAPEFYMLGDCVTPKNITAATSTAYMTARNIGRDY